MKLKFEKDQLNIEIADDTAMVTYKDNKLYNKSLPDSIDKDVAAEVNDFNAGYIKEVTERLNVETIDILKKNKGVTKVVTKMPYIPDSGGAISGVTHREKVYRIPGTDKVKTTAAVQVNITTSGKAANKKWLHSLADDINKSL
jgi:hypothetical protein